MVRADDMGQRGLLRSLVDVLCRVPALFDREGRNLVIRMMSSELDEPLFVEEHPMPVGHLFNLAEACHRTPERLSALVRSVSLVEQDSKPMAELRRIVGELTPADLFTTNDRARLFTLLAGVAVPDIADVYRAVAGPFAPNLYGPTTPSEVFRILETFNAGPDGLPPPLVFLERLASGVRPELSIELQRWTYAQARTMDLVDELARARERLRSEAAVPLTPPPGSPAYLVLRISSEGPTGDRYRLASWRQLGNPHQWAPLPGRDFAGPLAEVKREVAATIEQVEDAWGQYLPAIRIEFVLDYENLSLDVEQWPWENADHLVRPMGCRYPVVVRSLERMVTRRYHREWRERWGELARQLERNSRVAHASTCRAPAGVDDELRELLSLFDRERGLVSLVLSAPPDPDAAGRDPVAAGVRAGVPLVLWHREDCGSAEFGALVESLLHEEDERHLLERVRLVRTTAFAEGPARRHVGAALTVLYDDPTRLVLPSQPGPPEGAVA
ncbi:hypothetical protein Q5530_02335 [Saccharothrix sp. BKS2]|uniref:Uncharacterized protein n=1 Tax=Saccharothrix lopnurensis TaxID=1670621 RepID=A0ABW1NZJ3_9PSEU